MRIFTDGSSTVYHDKHNLRYGGIGVYVEDNTFLNFSKGYAGYDISNQLMELKACLYGILIYIKYIKKNNSNEQLYIYTDSMYVINCITKWAKQWELNDWKKSKNAEILHVDVIKKIYKLYNKYNINFVHINSHTKEPSRINYDNWKIWFGNFNADKLASIEMNSIKSKL